MPAIEQALKHLLDGLDELVQAHEEVGDTDVREQMFTAVQAGFLLPEPGFVLPESFGMFGADGNQAVRALLDRFIRATRACPLAPGEERLAAFQDVEVASSGGSTYDAYFGHADSLVRTGETTARPAPPTTGPAPAPRPWWKLWG